MFGEYPLLLYNIYFLSLILSAMRSNEEVESLQTVYVSDNISANAEEIPSQYVVDEIGVCFFCYI